MTTSKFKDKDYLQAMKKMTSPQPEIRQSLEEFDTCHHCKYMYLPHMLVTCRFTSERQSMPKISESETDFGEEASTSFLS